MSKSSKSKPLAKPKGDGSGSGTPSNGSAPKERTFLYCLISFVIGVGVGLGWAAYKGAPAGLEAPHQPRGVVEAPREPDQMGSVQAQLEKFQEQIRENPGDPVAYVQAGNLLYDNDLFEKALEYYNKAIEIGGENADVLTDAGICHRRLGRPEKAVEYFRRARKADPNHRNSAYNLGVVLLHDLKDKEAAAEAWREFLKLEPEGERATMIRRVIDQL